MTPEQVLRAYYENANEINAITARRQPTFEEKVKLAQMIGAHLKRNIIPQKREGAWFDRKRGDEGIYAVPNYHMLLGEIPGPIGGIGRVKSLIGEIKSHTMPNNNLERGLDYYADRYKDFSEIELRTLRDWTQTQNPYIAKRLGGNIESKLRGFKERVKPERFKPDTADAFVKNIDLTKVKQVELNKIKPIIGKPDDTFLSPRFDEGIKKPIFVNRKTGMIEDGNHRYFAAIKRGDKTIPVVYLEKEIPIHLDSKIKRILADIK